MLSYGKDVRSDTAFVILDQTIFLRIEESLFSNGTNNI